MGTPTVANILKGGAWVYWAPVGEPIPDETTVAYEDPWGGNWARVGFTNAPLTAAYEEEHADVTVEEHLGRLDAYRTDESLMLETTLAELTAEYLALATGQDPTTAVTTTPAGASQVGFEELGVGDVAVIQKYAWGFEGLHVDANGNNLPVRVFIWKASGKINGSLEFSRKSGNTPSIPLQVGAYTDPSQAVGERLWKWQRVTAPATA